MKSYKQFISEQQNLHEGYPPKSVTSKVRKVLNPYVIGRAQSHRGVTEFKFDQSKRGAVLDDLTKAFGHSSEEKYHTKFTTGSTEILVDKHDPSSSLPPPKNWYVLVRQVDN